MLNQRVYLRTVILENDCLVFQKEGTKIGWKEGNKERMNERSKKRVKK